MAAELFKCFLYGFCSIAAVVLLGWLTYALWPWSGYAWGGLFFICVCICLGSDMRCGTAWLGPR